jgi:hypothetical protein
VWCGNEINKRAPSYCVWSRSENTNIYFKHSPTLTTSRFCRRGFFDMIRPFNQAPIVVSFVVCWCLTLPTHSKSSSTWTHSCDQILPSRYSLIPSKMLFVTPHWCFGRYVSETNLVLTSSYEYEVSNKVVSLVRGMYTMDMA